MKIIKLKKKIPKIFVLPLIILLIFSIYSGFNKFQEKNDLNKISEYLKFSIISSNLIHELQKERGYSSGFMASKGKSFSLELKLQRKNTDKKIEQFRIFLNNFDHDKYTFPFEKPKKQFLEVLDLIDIHRADIDNYKLPIYETVNYYTSSINILLILIEQIATLSYDGKLTTLTQSYLTLINTKEKAGIERALINKVFGKGKLSNEEFYKFGVLVSAQRIYIEYFKDTAIQEHIDLLNSKMAAKSFKEVEKSRNIIYVKNKKNEILSFIKEMVGYGGLIHNFKNYVIRGEEKYAADVKKQYVQLIDNIHQYKMFENITLEEIDKLNIIKEVFTQYIEGVQKVKIAYQTGTDIHVLDKIVKVDDKPAIKALHDLTTNIYGSQSLWFKQSTLRINSLKEIENKIADDLDIFINNQTNTLSIGLIAQVIIVVAILVIIFFSVAMLRELIESEKRLNRAQESTKSGSYEYHIEKNVIIWSDEHYKLLQVDKETFKPTIDSFMKFVHPDDVQIVKKNMDMAISSKKIVFFEYRLILTDNTEIFTKSSAEVTKYDKKGDPLIIVGTITDITQSKELEQEIIDTQKDVVFTMGAIGETRSRETGHHVKRVAEYSKLLYLLSGANEDDAELLKMASPMHDIGKVGIPDHILNKPGKLTSEEWTIMQTHSEMGYEMLKNSNREILKLAATVALTHHEKYDGSGYPKGLIAQEIPLVGRITALADVFDALGSHRCYKTAWELEKILNMLKEERAKHFDPHLIDLFIGNLDKFLEIRNSYKDII